MTNEQLSEQTIRYMLKEIHNEILEVKAQVIKTNGRVGNLEVWRGFITGGLAILAILVIPLLLNYLKGT